MRSQRQRPCTEKSAEDNSHGRENTLLQSWKNCIGCQWNSELTFSLSPHPLWAFKLMETSYKTRHHYHHHHHQLKATKQSISLRQPSTTPCSHGSWDRLNWDGGGGRSTDSPSPRPTPPRDDGGKDYIPHHHQNQLSFQTGFNLGSSWMYVLFTIFPNFCAHGTFVVLWLSLAWFLLFLLGVNYYFYGDQAY